MGFNVLLRFAYALMGLNVLLICALVLDASQQYVDASLCFEGLSTF